MSADLSNYGVDPEKEPRVYRKAWVKSPTTGKIAGFTGVERRRGNNAMVYTTLRSDWHFYEKGGGYAISDSILSTLEGLGVSRVLVHEGTTPEDDVYEFRAQDYFTAESIPDGDLEDEGDPQSFVSLDEHLHHWPNYSAALFVESFEDACERIGTRRGGMQR